MATVEVVNRTRVKVNPRPIEAFTSSVLEATRDFKSAEVSITLVGDRRMQNLNKCWRGIERPTDVLSFPMDENGSGPAAGPLILGDIVIAARQAITDADEEGVRLEEKMRELIMHSLLHLMGYGHESPENARRMELRRKQILKKIDM